MFEITSAHLKVFSNVCGNLVVVWLVAGAAAFVAKEQFVLTMDIIAGTIAWYLAVRAETILEGM